SPAAGTPANWSYNPPGISFTNNHQYQLTVTALDNAQNQNSAVATFVFDTQVPTSTIMSPVAGFVKTLTGVQGTASDVIPAMQFASKLSTGSVSVGIQLVGTGWWNGSDFTSGNPMYYTAVNSTTPSPNTWTYTFGGNLPGAIAAQSGQSI